MRSAWACSRRGDTQLALADGMPGIVAVFMGMVSAVFGGVLRDVVCNEIPSAFRDHRPYALCSFIGGWVMLAADRLDWSALAAVLASAFVTTSLRVLALVLDLKLPEWSHAADDQRR